MSTAVTSLGPLAKAAYCLQEYDLVNRGVLEGVGVAGPVVALTRTPEERREKILDRAIVLGSAFVLAPLHAWGFMRLFGRKLPNANLMRLSYRDLYSTQTLQTALTRLQSQIKTLKPFTGKLEDLRKTLIQAKTKMLIPDLMMECVIFSGVGWITNWLTRNLTGKNQFTGELAATSRQNIQALQQKEKAYQDNERLRLLATMGLSVLVPLGLGLGIRKALLTPNHTSGVLNWLKTHASKFDYKDGIWMSLASLGVVVGMQFFGHLMSARNPREFKEKFVRESMFNAVFFWGNPLWMWLLTRPVYKHYHLPLETNVQAMVAKCAPKNRALALKVGSLTYLGSVLANCAMAGGIIYFNNFLTQKRVDRDVAQLPPTFKNAPPAVVPIVPWVPFVSPYGGVAPYPNLWARPAVKS